MALMNRIKGRFYRIILEIELFIGIDNVFNFPQQIVLSEAKEKGIDISKFLSPKFGDSEMYFLSRQLKNGKDISAYADPRFTWSQMERIAYGIEYGIDITQYNNPLFTVDQMNDIIFALKEGKVDGEFSEDMYNPMRLYLPVDLWTNQLFLGYRGDIHLYKNFLTEKQINIDSKGNFYKYLDEDNKYIQIDKKTAIREFAIHKVDKNIYLKEANELGIDTSKLSSQDFDHNQIKFLLDQLKAGRDISAYADTKFNIWQMEKIAYGVQHGLDISKYANPLLSEREMTDIIYSLEYSNIDEVKEYRESVEKMPFNEEDFFKEKNISLTIEEFDDGYFNGPIFKFKNLNSNVTSSYYGTLDVGEDFNIGMRSPLLEVGLTNDEIDDFRFVYSGVISSLISKSDAYYNYKPSNVLPIKNIYIKGLDNNISMKEANLGSFKEANGLLCTWAKIMDDDKVESVKVEFQVEWESADINSEPCRYQGIFDLRSIYANRSSENLLQKQMIRNIEAWGLSNSQEDTKYENKNEERFYEGRDWLKKLDWGGDLLDIGGKCITYETPFKYNLHQMSKLAYEGEQGFDIVEYGDYLLEEDEEELVL
ncbi:hypothetical protein [Clostridium cellulovorans]|uniref:Uncharacterized protein n=1 Tax=Clostridium cellulovorans (strain ATCC 35296 / DSM 3052 / OCM 3 / 743B) TaxID=573061 RepID=D9SPS5_CLOC7|nr:hypothetical protein [Clostridium cellulovorans]ADL52061.1 hypothetical protein Clocel_2343 [Clostridium cellulovorans 743B]